jgi:hypothetical protein
MTPPKRSTLAMLMKNLLTQLQDARDKSNREALVDLFTTFSVLVEASYASEDVQSIGFIENLLDSARDSLGGVDWKSDLPSIDSVDGIFSS